MDYNLFSVFQNPVLIVDSQGLFVFANESFLKFFTTSLRDLNGQNPFKLLQTKLNPIPSVSRPLNEHTLISFSTEAASSAQLQAETQATLALAENESRRLDWQMKFLLNFYAETRFIADIETIALKFMLQACVDLGFLAALCFSFSEDQKSAQLVNYYSLSGKLKAAPEITADQTFFTVAESPFLQIHEPLKILNAFKIDELKALGFYQNFGIQHVDNAAVLTISRGQKILGQFHLINHSMTDKISAPTIKLLEYMIDPLTLTFENVDLYLSSITDELTKIYNARYFKMRLKTELHQAARTGRPLTLLIIEIDNFKAIKDTHGHAMSEQVLATVAQTLKSSVRGFDITARYSGEEFAMLLLETDAAAAVASCQRIQQNVGKLIFRTDDAAFKVNLSIGSAVTDQHGLDLAILMEAATKALHV